MGRMLGIAFGLATHALFGVTVWYLFWFLKDGAAEGPGALPWDGLLAFQFGAIHSLVLWPPSRRRLAAWFPAELLRLYLLHGDLPQPAGDLCLLAGQSGRLLVARGLAANRDPGGVRGLVDRADL